MFSFNKRLQRDRQILTFSIETTDAGWEVREEHDSQVVRRVQYQDWHRVERATRTISMTLDELQRRGWSEVSS